MNNICHICGRDVVSPVDPVCECADQLRILDAEHQRLAAKCLRYKEGLELVANLRDSEEARIARIYLN
jgi:hypothetical protein